MQVSHVRGGVIALVQALAGLDHPHAQVMHLAGYPAWNRGVGSFCFANKVVLFDFEFNVGQFFGYVDFDIGKLVKHDLSPLTKIDTVTGCYLLSKQEFLYSSESFSNTIAVKCIGIRTIDSPFL